MALMDAPATADVRASPGERLTNHLPRYLVLPSAIPQPKLLTDCKVKVIDLGSAFFSDHHPRTTKMRCPLPFRAPEAVITNQWGKEADIWSLGCTVRTCNV
jgi:serine/threonine protein kinase